MKKVKRREYGPLALCVGRGECLGCMCLDSLLKKRGKSTLFRQEKQSLVRIEVLSPLPCSDTQKLDTFYFLFLPVCVCVSVHFCVMVWKAWL